MLRIYEFDTLEPARRARSRARQLGLTIQPRDEESFGSVAEVGASGDEAALAQLDTFVATLGGRRIQ